MPSTSIQASSKTMDAHWYAFYSKPMKEALLWEQLHLHQIESYYPLIRVQPVNPRARKVKPYFSRYVLGHFELRARTVVTVQEEPFKGYEAIFDAHLSGEDGVRVFLKLLSRQHIPLELPSSQIQCKKQ